MTKEERRAEKIRMLVQSGSLFWDAAKQLCTESLCAQLGEGAFRPLHEAIASIDSRPRLSYEEDRRLWFGLGGRMVDAAWREAGNRVQWRGRGCR